MLVLQEKTESVDMAAHLSREKKLSHAMHSARMRQKHSGRSFSQPQRAKSMPMSLERGDEGMLQAYAMQKRKQVKTRQGHKVKYKMKAKIGEEGTRSVCNGRVVVCA